MSTRERRNRKDSRAKTLDQLWHRRCIVCAQPITHSQRWRMIAGRNRMAHEDCPAWGPE